MTHERARGSSACRAAQLGKGAALDRELEHPNFLDVASVKWRALTTSG
jgi:hypothetical protein